MIVNGQVYVVLVIDYMLPDKWIDSIWTDLENAKTRTAELRRNNTDIDMEYMMAPFDLNVIEYQ